MTSDFGLDPMTDTYTALVALYDTLDDVVILPPGVGESEIDITEIFMKAAAAGGNQVFVAYHEEVFPAATTVDGSVQTDGQMHVDLVYTKNPAEDTDVSPAVDTHMDRTQPTLNLESSTTISILNDGVGPRHTSCLEFDLTSIDPSDFDTVTLRLVSNGDSLGLSLEWEMRRDLQLWVLTETTWDIFSTGNSWSTAGAEDSGTDYDPTPLVTWPAGILTPGSVHISPDIKAMAVEAKAGDGILRLLIAKVSALFISSSLRSQDHATPADRPLLQFRI